MSNNNNNNNRNISNLLHGRRAPTMNNLANLLRTFNNLVIFKNLPAYPKVKNNLITIQALINKIPLKRNWNTVKLSTPALFHGSKVPLTGGYPNKPEGSWFAKSPHQAILHAVSRSQGGPTYLYVYHLKERPKLIDIKSSENFNKLGVHVLRKIPFGTWAFSNKNRNISKKLCEITPKIADGWHFPKDQNQVMLCRPKEFLELYKVYKISGSEHSKLVNFKVNWAGNEGYWKRPRGLRYGLTPVNFKSVKK